MLPVPPIAAFDAPGWIGAGLTAVALAIGVLAYLSQRNKKKLEWMVTTNAELLPGEVAHHLEVSHAGNAIADPSLVVVRMVSMGNRAINPQDFETDLILKLDGADSIANAACTGMRPGDLGVQLEVEGTDVHIRPTLLNPGDMVQLHVVTSGAPDSVEVAGRIADLDLDERDRLPYPPGSGDEGEMNSIDRFVWYVITPALILGVGVWVAIAVAKTGLAWTAILAAAAVACWLDAKYTAFLVERRRRWKPPALTD